MSSLKRDALRATIIVLAATVLVAFCTGMAWAAKHLNVWAFCSLCALATWLILFVTFRAIEKPSE